MRQNLLLILLAIILQSCVIIDEIFPPEKVQVVDPVKRKPLLNNSVYTGIGLNQNNSINGLYPLPPAPPNNGLGQLPTPPATYVPAVPPQAPVQPQTAPRSVTPEYSQKPISLPNAPVFESPYPVNQAVPAPNFAANPVPPVRAIPAPPPPQNIPPKVMPEAMVADNAALNYPKLGEVRAPEVARRDSSLDQRVAELKRELAQTKSTEQNRAPANQISNAPLAPPRPPARAPQNVPPQAIKPIIPEQMAYQASAPVAQVNRAPIIPPAPITQFAPPPPPIQPQQQAVTYFSDLKMPVASAPARASNLRIQSSNSVESGDYYNGYVYSPNNKYRHSNIRRGY